MSQHFWRGRWAGSVLDGDHHQRAREVLRPSGGIMRGKFPSRKNGRMIHHEGLLELDAIYLFEASPLITKYREQPRLIQFPDGGRLRRYTPDFELELQSGELIIVEVKPSRSLSNEEVQHKLNCIHEHMQRNSSQFEVLTEVTIRLAPRLANLRWIYHRAARTPPTPASIERVVDRHRAGFPLAIQAAINLTQDTGIEPFSMLLAGALQCSLDGQISYDTQLNIATEANHEWFRISEKYSF